MALIISSRRHGLRIFGNNGKERLSQRAILSVICNFIVDCS